MHSISLPCARRQGPHATCANSVSGGWSRRKAALLLALGLAALPPGAAHAHTISIGYENSGQNELTFWYGSYHGGGATEGDISLTGQGMDEQFAFDLLVSGKPSGLEDGRTNFYSGGTCTTLVDYNCYGTAVDYWQGREFSVTAPGDYTFTYVPIANPTQNWEPTNNAILSDTLSVITADLDINTPTIGTGQTEDETWQQPGGPIIFEGGTLALTADASIGRVISLDDDGGTIDTSGNDLTYTGDMDGRGRLTKAGDGTLYMNGTNSGTGGMALNGGAVRVDSDGQFGAAGADLSFDGGALQFGDSFDIDNGRDITFKVGGGTLDTRTHDTTVTQAISGRGGLAKAGTGVLNLRGNNTFDGDLTIAQGTVDVRNDANMGDGDVVLGDATLRFSQPGTSSKAIHLGAPGAAVDTMAHDLVLDGDLAGAGTLNKTGTGMLTLSGNNSHNGINLDMGDLEVDSAAALGSTDGTLRLAANTRLNLVNDMIVEQSLQIDGSNAAINTGANDIVVHGTAGGTACLTKSGSGSMDLRANGSNDTGACIEEGRLHFNALFDGDVWVYANGVAGGSGTINGDVEVTGVLAPGNSPGITTVNGSVTQGPGSTLEIEIDGPTPGNGAGFHDQLRLLGENSVYTADGTLDAMFRGISAPANNDYTPEIGESFTIVTAEGGIEGTFNTFAQPTAGMPGNARLDIGYLSNIIVLGVTPLDYGTYTGEITSANGQAVAAVTDQIRQPAGAYDTSASGRFQAGLIGLDQEQLATTFEQAAGEVHADTMDAVARSHRSVRDTVSQRLAGNGSRDSASGQTADVGDDDDRLWVTLLATDGDVEGDRRARGYDSDSQSILIGREKRYGTAFTGGMALGLSSISADAGELGTGDADSYEALVYGRWSAGDVFVNAVGSAGFDAYRIRRHVDLLSGPERVEADPDGTHGSLDVEIGREFRMQRTMLVPMAGLAYMRLDREGVSEEGSPSVALEFSDETRDSLEGRIGGHLQLNSRRRDKGLRSYLSAFLVHEFRDQSSTLEPQLHGVRFESAAPEPGRDRVELGAGLELAMSRQTRVSVVARGEQSADAQSFSAGVSLDMRW